MGVMRSYVSQIENGRMVPTINTLEKFARALEVPIYAMFYDGERPPKMRNLPKVKEEFDGVGEDARYINQIIRLLNKMSERDRKLLLALVGAMAKARGLG